MPKSTHADHVKWLQHQYALSAEDAEREAQDRYVKFPQERDRWNAHNQGTHDMDHTVTVNDYTPGTGPSVLIHRTGCGHASIERADETVRCSSYDEAHTTAGVVARRWGLGPLDYGVNDCALI